MQKQMHSLLAITNLVLWLIALGFVLNEHVFSVIFQTTLTD